MSRRKSRFPELRRDANGRFLCRGCGGDVPKGRRTWCGSECNEKHNPFFVNRAAWERDGGKCRGCGDQLTRVRRGMFIKLVEYDHIIPFSEGGKTVLENIQCLCRECHKKKTAEWRRSKRKKPAQVELLEEAK